MMNRPPDRVARSCLATLMLLAVGASAGMVPSELPDPDGKPGDAGKPVKVYVLAGQSNMVGFGYLGGAKPSYQAIFLTADPDAPLGPFGVYRGGNYRIADLGIYVSADPKSATGAVAMIGGKALPVALGNSTGSLPVANGQPCVVSAFVEVPATGTYICGPG